MNKFVKGFIAGLGTIFAIHIIDAVLTDKRLNKKREEFYEKNGF